MGAFSGNSSLIGGGFDPRRVDNNPEYILRTVTLYLSLTLLSLFLYTALRNTYKPFLATRLCKTKDNRSRNRTPRASSGRWRVGSSSFTERSALLRAEREPQEDTRLRRRKKRFGAYFQWVPEAMKLDEAELIKVCGMDAYLSLRLIRWALKVLMTYNVVGVFVLVPVYKMQPSSDECKAFCMLHESSEGEQGFDAFTAQCICNAVDQMSLANLRSDDRLSLWVPVAAMVYFAAATLLFLSVEYKNVIRIRLAYYQSRPPHLYTVLVQGIPKRLQSASGRLLKEHFERVFPGTVHSVYSFQHPSEMLLMLQHIGEERFALLNQLELGLLVQQQPEGSRRFNRRLFSDCCSPPHSEEMAELYAELTTLNHRFSRLRTLYLRSLAHQDTVLLGGENVPSSPPSPSSPTVKLTHQKLTHQELPNSAVSVGGIEPAFPVAFVTFRSLVSAMIAVQSQLYDSHKLTVRTAPEPRDIVWENLGIGHNVQVTRNLLSKALFALIVLFWGVISSFIGVATSTAALSRSFPWINQLLKAHPELVTYFDQLAPLVLAGSVSVVNPIIWYLTKLEGLVAYSEIDLRTMERYFVFLVVQVFVFYSVAGTVAKTVVEILSQPKLIVSTLATTIPKNASFYIAYVLVELFWLSALELLRAYDFLFAALRKVLTLNAPETKRMKRTTVCGIFPFSFPSPRNLSSINAQMLLIFFIATTYAPIQPLVLPAAMVFFAFSNLAYTTVFTTSSKQTFDCAGKSWSSAFWCLVSALVTSQLTLIGVLLIKSGFTQAMAMSVLCGLTLFAAYLIDATYKPIAHDLPIFLASELDSKAIGGVASDLSTEEAKWNAVKVVELQPSIWRYSTLTHGHDDDAHRRAPVPANVVNVYTYSHPVLAEKDVELPDTAKPDYVFAGGGDYGSRGSLTTKA